MALNDPANLVERIAELAPLAADPKIEKAIATGDPFKVYRAILWAKWFRRLPAHQAALDALARNRRLFAKPLRGKPLLGSLNGFGLSFVGRSEKQADDTFIAKHAFVVLFFIPLIPLRSYLVRKAGGSLFSSQWEIFARVPSGIVGVVFARAVLALAVLLVIGGVFTGVERSRTQEVYVVNGFDVPLDVVLDGQSRTVAPLGHERIHVKAGMVQGTATAKGVRVDTFDHRVASASDGAESVWNVAGAAPLFREEVTYYKKQVATPAEPPEPTVYCGRQFVEVPNVDDAFQASPESVKMSKYVDHVTRVRLDVARADGQAGYVSCMNYLQEHQQATLAARFMQTAAVLKAN